MIVSKDNATADTVGDPKEIRINMKYNKNIAFCALSMIITITTNCNDTINQKTEEQKSEKEKTAEEQQTPEQKKAAEKEEAYKQYRKEQEAIDKEISKIPGACPLSVDESFVTELLKDPSEEIKMAISRINQNKFCDNDKNIIFQGFYGVGKSSTAQAIAIKCQIPCLRIKVGSLLTEGTNSVVQTLNAIFEYVLKRDKRYVVLIEDSEALNKKPADIDSHDYSAIINFYQTLYKFNKSKIIFFSTINSTEHLPAQITDQASVIKISLPDRSAKQTISDYHLAAEKNKYNFEYPAWFTGAYLAQRTDSFFEAKKKRYLTPCFNWMKKQTDGFSIVNTEKKKRGLEYINWTENICFSPKVDGFSPKELRNVIIRTTAFARLGGVITENYCAAEIKKIKEDPTRKLAREIGTWRHSFKKLLRNPRVPYLIAVPVGLSVLYNQIQMRNQTQKNADRQIDHQKETMSKQTILNLTIFGIPIGFPVYCALKKIGGVEYVHKKIWDESKHITHK